MMMSVNAWHPFKKKNSENSNFETHNYFEVAGPVRCTFILWFPLLYVKLFYCVLVCECSMNMHVHFY